MAPSSAIVVLIIISDGLYSVPCSTSALYHCLVIAAHQTTPNYKCPKHTVLLYLPDLLKVCPYFDAMAMAHGNILDSFLSVIEARTTKSTPIIPVNRQYFIRTYYYLSTKRVLRLQILKDAAPFLRQLWTFATLEPRVAPPVQPQLRLCMMP